MKQLSLRAVLAASVAITILACGGAGNPRPASYQGYMPNSTSYNLAGNVVFTISETGEILGTLRGEVSPNTGTWEVRGEVEDTVFRGEISKRFERTYQVRGNIYGVRNDIQCQWRISLNGSEEESVSFSMDQL